MEKYTRPNWVDVFGVLDAIDILSEDSLSWKLLPENAVQTMEDAHPRSLKERDAWKKIFKFRHQIDLSEQTVQGKKFIKTKKTDKYAQQLIAVYTKYNCTQQQAAAYTGIDRSTVRRLTRLPEVNKAYQDARYQYQLKYSRNWHRKRAAAKRRANKQHA